MRNQEGKVRRIVSSLIPEQGVTLLKWLVPGGLWIFLFRDIFLGTALVSGESFSYFATYRAYLNHLSLGTVPFWNPYILWGAPEHFYLSQFGPFSPLWLLGLLLIFWGCPVYLSYLVSLTVYVFLGWWGFYLLARIFFKEEEVAYSAGLLLLFSSLSLPIFSQPIMLLCFVPAVWFFYFLASFGAQSSRVNFLGLIFFLGQILSTYLPFYFLTVLGLILFFGGLLFPKMILGQAIRMGQFMQKQVGLVLLSVGFLVLSPFFSYQSFLDTRLGSVVVPFRQQAQDIFSKGLELDYSMARDGALSARMAFEDLFFHLNQIQYGNDGFFYVSFFVWPVLFLGALNRITRRSIFFLALTLTIFLLAMDNAAPVHRFLYKHIFYFKFFRNCHFFLPYLLGVFFLFVAEQCRLIWEERKHLSLPRWKILGTVLGLHVWLLIFLFWQRESVIWSSYVALGLSAAFFSGLVGQTSGGKPWLRMICLMGLILIQPLEVFWHYQKQAKAAGVEPGNEAVRAPFVKPAFSFSRPLSKDAAETAVIDRLNFYRALLRDSGDFVTTFGYGFPAYWSYYLARQDGTNVFRRYAAHKFWLYDEVRVVPGSATESFTAWRDVLARQQGVAIVAGPDSRQSDAIFDKLSVLSSTKFPPAPEPVEKNEPSFEILDFNSNAIQIRTHFSQNRFLVYTDSFHHGWRAWCNREEIPIFQANVAFKGIFLPAGENDIVMRFGSPVKIGLYWLILGLNGTAFVMLVMGHLRCWRRKTLSAPCRLSGKYRSDKENGLAA